MFFLYALLGVSVLGHMLTYVVLKKSTLVKNFIEMFNSGDGVLNILVLICVTVFFSLYLMIWPIVLGWFFGYLLLYNVIMPSKFVQGLKANIDD